MQIIFNKKSCQSRFEQHPGKSMINPSTDKLKLPFNRYDASVACLRSTPSFD